MTNIKLTNLLALFVLGLCLAAGVAAAERPNIVYILADDLGYGELSSYGQSRYETPNIDRLAAEGMKFTQHYSGNPVCAPSRCALLTGLHTGHTQIRGNKQIGGKEGWELGSITGGQFPIREDTVTLGKLLQNAGYRTGAVGKWGLGMTSSTGAPNRQGFDHFFGYICQRQAHTHYPNHLWRNDEVVWLKGNDDGKLSDHSHDLMTQEAVQFVADNSKSSFFLYVAFAIPHVSIQATPEAMALFKGKYEETAFPGESMYFPQPTPRAGYAAMIHMLDDSVGQILEQLEDSGVADNTLVIFSSDNGPTFNGGSDSEFFNSAGPFSGLKGSVYEGGIRVPMIARWPAEIAAGTVNDHVSAFWDVLPTVTEIAGIEAPGGIDGISMLPGMLGQKERQRRHQYLYWELSGQQAIRMGNWKALRRMDRKTRKQTATELYDLASDPGEIHNVATQYAEITNEMNELFVSARTPSVEFPLVRQR
jgi:arylsulfatase A-like enzyme